MISTLILLAGVVVGGDSIAVGTGHALGVPTYARERMSSCWIEQHMPPPAAVTILSAGINDPPGACVGSLRSRVHGRVIWILPAAISSARAHVSSVAAAHGDATVSYRCQGGCSATNFHPASYAAVASEVRRLLAQEK